MLVVERAQLARRRPGLGREPRGRRLGDAERRAGERQPREQVVPVGVRREQAGEREARVLEHGRQHLELVGQDRRVDDEALARPDPDPSPLRSPLRTIVHVVCQMRLVTTSDVAVQADGAHGAAPLLPRARYTPSSLTASARFLTSAVGFFWPGSSVSLWRLTQITGILFFTAGSTSW